MSLEYSTKGRRRRGCPPETRRMFQREMGRNILADMAAVRSSRQSSLKMQNLSYENELDFHDKTQFDLDPKDNCDMASSPYHLERIVTDDNIDLPVHFSDIHGIPRPDESRHFDGRPRAV